MTAPPLTIRNLTSTPIELKLVERYEAPGSSEPEHHFSKFARNITNLVANATNDSTPSAPQLAENAQSFTHEDVSVRIDPFRTVKTNIKATERGPNDIIRLTFENDGQKYRMDAPSTSFASQILKPLSPNPHHQYTAVFLPNHSHLALYSSANLQCWMKELHDQTPISGLSIPGTHNSPTCHRALPSVRCQAVSPREQLENGIRFFDIRVKPDSPTDVENDRLELVHSVFPISLTGPKYFRDLVNETLAFLDRNPSETVIISVKREGTGNASDQHLSKILHKHYARDQNRWYTTPRIPKLGEVRHKIVLMRRFALDDEVRRAEHGGSGWGLEAENWADNTPNDNHGAVCVQDFYEVLETENIDKKIKFATEHLDRSAACVCPVPGISTDAEHPVPPPPIYLNFLSASNFWKVGCWPENIAAKINPSVTEHLCLHHREGGDHGDGATGVVVCDYVGKDGDWDLVRCIVGMNSMLASKEKR